MIEMIDHIYHNEMWFIILYKLIFGFHDIDCVMDSSSKKASTVLKASILFGSLKIEGVVVSGGSIPRMWTGPTTSHSSS